MHGSSPRIAQRSKHKAPREWNRSQPAPAAGSRIRDASAHDQPVPDEQDQQGADYRADQSRAFARAIPADSLADEGRKDRADDTQHRGQNESNRIVGAGSEQAGDDAS